MSRERDRLDDEVGKKIKRDASTGGGGGGGGGGRHINVEPPPPPPGILNTVTPCAACKLLRRRCAQECPFSPYFSPLEPHKFASVHKVFGASNVSKMLMEVGEKQRADAANSLVYEANVRLRDPIYGCMGAISALQLQIHVLQSQLNAVRAHILNYKSKQPNILDPHTFNDHYHHLITYPSPEAAISVAAPPLEPPLNPVEPPASSDFSSISNENISYFG